MDRRAATQAILKAKAGKGVTFEQIAPTDVAVLQPCDGPLLIDHCAPSRELSYVLAANPKKGWLKGCCQRRQEKACEYCTAGWPTRG
jgi:hypothetical protein